MIDIPDSVKQLFKQDSISKNFRVHFVHGEHRDLVNADFVSESVSFTESAMSSDTLKFGLCESGSIEFRTYFNENIKDLLIFCSIEIDISSLSQSEIEEYGQTSSDVPYPFYSVPYGYFVVDSCERMSDIYSVVAYNDKTDRTKISRVFQSPAAITKLLKWGRQYAYQADAEEKIMTFPITSVVQSCLTHNLSEISAAVDVRSSNSPVFNWQKNYFSISSISDSLFHNLCNPTIEVEYREVPNAGPAGKSRFYLYAKGRYVYFPYASYDSGTISPPMFSKYTRNDVEQNNYKNRYLTLPYRLSMRTSNRITWENTISATEAINDIYDTIATYYNTNRDTIESSYGLKESDLLRLMSPSIKFIDVSTWPYSSGRYPETDLPEKVITFPAKCMTSALTRSDEDLDINSSQRLIHIPSVEIDDNVYQITFPDVRGMLLSEHHKEYYSDSDYFYSTSFVAVCIPTEINIVINGSDLSAMFPPSYADTNYNNHLIPVNSFTNPELIGYDDTIRDLYPYSKYDLPELMFKLSECKDINQTYEEFIYDLSGSIASTYYVYNNKDNAEDIQAKSVLSDFAEYTGRFLVYDRLNPFHLRLAELSKLSDILYPSDTLYPDNELYPSGTNANLDRSMWRTLTFSEHRTPITHRIKYLHKEWPYDSSRVFYDFESYVITIDINEENNTAIYDVSSNWIFKNHYVPATVPSQGIFQDRWDVLILLTTSLNELSYNKASAKIRALPFLEATDSIHILTKESGIITYAFRHRITGIQSLIDNIESC